MYTAPEGERLTPSPTDSPRSHQIVPAGRYAMQPFFQDQFVNNLPQNRFYGGGGGGGGGGGERAVPQTNGFLSASPPEDAATQRWFVASMQQGGANGGSSAPNKLELTPYEGEYPGSLLPYGLKPLSVPTAHPLSYYPPDSPFGSVAAAAAAAAAGCWGSTRGPYQRKVSAPGLPWSPRPSPTAAAGFPDDLEGKEKAQPRAQADGSESESGGLLLSAWTDTQSGPALTPDKPDSDSAYAAGCKRRRLSLGGSTADGLSLAEVKSEELGLASTVHSAPYSKEAPHRGLPAYYSFYTSP